jgi:DNA repair protein RecO
MASFFTSAYLVYSQTTGEANRLLTLLTKHLGLVKVTAFGAARSQGERKLATTPFALVEVKLTDSKGGYKLELISLTESFANINSNIQSYYLAHFFNETLIKSESGGQDNRFYSLYHFLFNLLNRGNLTEAYQTFLLCFLHYNGQLPAFIDESLIHYIETENFAQLAQFSPLPVASLTTHFRQVIPFKLQSLSFIKRLGML